MKNKIKGVLLCGGKGTRLLPATKCLNKHLIPILNRPMVLYPLETLKSFGIEDILLVSGGEHLGGFIDFLSDGSEYKVDITYRVQINAGGIAEALNLAKKFVGDSNVMVVLGDNIYGDIASFPVDLDSNKAHLWLKEVSDAKRFGVGQFEDDRLIKIIEKPEVPPSDWAVTGLYKYTPEVFDFTKTMKPSMRGEKEITDVNNWYIEQGKCDYTRIPNDKFWRDCGTPESLAEVTKWAIENRQKDKNVF